MRDVTASSQFGNSQAASGVWQSGWLTSAKQVPTPNFGPRLEPAIVRLVVLHSISLPPGEFGNGHIEQLFTNTLNWDAHPYFQSIRGAEVSSHFVIARNGTVTQYVSVLNRAWHAGKSTWHGVDNCNDFSIGIELEGLEGGGFEAAQYVALAQLSLDVLLAFPTIEGFAGHEHIAPGRKQDPGPGFNWAHLKAALGDRSHALFWPVSQTP